MDLAEIRKKSKKQQESRKVAEPSVSTPAEEPVPPAEPRTEPSKPAPSGGQDALPTTASQTRNTPAPSGDAPERDVLDALFATTPDLALATEEVYLQGLEGREEQVDADQQQWLTFGLGKEQYALDICFVREIIKPREITDIPRVPGFILGVISLRGVIVPIYDLCRRLNLGTSETGSRSRIIVCEQGDRVAGLLVDRITQVVRFAQDDIEPPPAILSGLDRELVEGVGRVQGKMIILLDLPSVLDVELK